MVKVILTFLCTILHYQLSSSQCLRSQPYNIINRQIPDILEAPRIIQSPTVIADPPVNSIVPIPASSPSTTIITDCSPTVCKNLANTIQLMIVCNLLQNSRAGSEMALQLAGPILNEVMTSPVLTCGCSNPIPNVVSPSVISPNYVTPNVVTPSVITPNVITPNLLASVLNSNLVESSKFITPNIISSMPPIATIPTSISPITNMNYNSGSELLKSLISLLGNRM